MRVRRMNSLISLIPILLTIACASAAAQLLPENLKLSQTRPQPVVPASVRIQAVAENDGLDLVVWGSSMRDGERAHPVLYFAILQDSTILVPPTRMTGLESVPNTFVQVLPLSGRWGVIWTNDTGANARSRCIVVSPDGSLGDQFELWEGHPITRHGARAVRMGSADFICWSDTGEVRTVGRWLGHTDLVPEYLIIVDTGYLYLTRDYCSNIDGGLIETSAVKFCLVKENRSIITRSRHDIGEYDSYGVDDSCRFYGARDRTVEKYPTVFSTVPDVSNEIVVESFYSKAPIIRFAFGSNGEVEVSTFHVYLTGGGPYSSWNMSDRRYLLDDSLRIVRDTLMYIGSHPFPGTDKGETRFVEEYRQRATTDRLPDNGGARSFVAETTYGRTGDKTLHTRWFIFGGYHSMPLSDWDPIHAPLLLTSPVDAIAPSRLHRNPGNSPSVYFQGEYSRPMLVDQGARFDRETIDRQPRLAQIGTRVFASWFSCAADTVLYTTEILRSKSGEVFFGDAYRFFQGQTDISARNIINYGPIVVHSSAWKSDRFSYVELRRLALKEGQVEWPMFYRDSVLNAEYVGGAIDTLLHLAQPYYDPDERVAQVILFRYLNAFDVGMVHARTLVVDADRGVVDSVDLVVPVTDNARFYSYRNVGYVPIARDSYLLMARPDVFRVQDGMIVDTLINTSYIGKEGKIALTFGDGLVERTTGPSRKGIRIRLYDPVEDTAWGPNATVERDGIEEGQTLIRPSDSAALHIYRWRDGVIAQTYNRLTDSFDIRQISASRIEACSPSGVFTGDTLWTVFEVKSGESYQIYLNAVIPDDGIASVPVAGGEPTEGFAVEQSGGRFFIRTSGAFESGYVVDILGRVVAILDEGQMRGEEGIDMSGLPAGTYLVVMCAEECVARRVGMW